MSFIVEKAFTEAVNESLELYDEDELEKRVEQAEQIIDNAMAPHYHRMKTWILLGSVHGGWGEANECFFEVESMWQIVRRSHRTSEKAETDTAMEELRGALEALKGALAEDKPAYAFDEEVVECMAGFDAAVRRQNDIDRAAEYETSEDSRQAEELYLSWSLTS